MHIFTGTLSGFTDCIRNAAGFANAKTHLTAIVTHNHRYPEGKSTTAFDDLGYPGDVDYSFVQLIPIFVASEISSHFNVLPSDLTMSYVERNSFIIDTKCTNNPSVQ